MMYEAEIKESILLTLENRISRITFIIGKLLEEGYIPNNKKTTLLSWYNILIHAYNHLDSLNEEQQNNLDRIYNIIIEL